MFIKKITIKNFRLFPSESEFVVDNISEPDNENEGSGLTVFVGENGTGKTALLDAFSLPLLQYKTEKFGIENFNDPHSNIEVNIYSQKDFDVAGTMPNSSFKAEGFRFKASMRSRRLRAYLSSMVVNDQEFIKVDSLKPKDGSPDLRVNVDNPFMGKRFDENDVLFLDRNRIFQTRSGNFNTTRFDRLMEDFNYQYLKSAKTDIANLNDELDNQIKKDRIQNNFLSEAINKFKEISGLQIELDFLNNYEPFKNAFFATKEENNQQIPLSSLGSGYEMIFALLYSFYLSRQGGKELIVLIDEPELHLHPRLQEKFVEFLLELSKEVQIFLASHSSLLVKQLSENDRVKIRILGKDRKKVPEIEKRVLSYSSANETNFLAFNLATEEYHNELYEELKFNHGDGKTYKEFDNDFFIVENKEIKNSRWKEKEDEVSEHTFIRNQIHHRGENGKTKYKDLKTSIEKMRSFF